MRAGSDCPTGKEQYSKAGARDELPKLRRAMKDRTLSSYHCPFCECWHIGHTRRADKKRALGGR